MTGDNCCSDDDTAAFWSLSVVTVSENRTSLRVWLVGKGDSQLSLSLNGSTVSGVITEGRLTEVGKFCSSFDWKFWANDGVEECLG